MDLSKSKNIGDIISIDYIKSTLENTEIKTLRNYTFASIIAFIGIMLLYAIYDRWICVFFKMFIVLLLILLVIFISFLVAEITKKISNGESLF